MSAISVNTHGSVREVLLNSPETLNALDIAMARDLLARLKGWRDDGNVSCVIIRGADGKVFCAGGDIRWLYERIQAEDFAACDDFFATEYQLDYALYAYPKPLIAWVDGIVMGGGMGIMQACRHRVVGERVRMAMPETLIGLIPDVGSGDFLNTRCDRLQWLLPLTGGHAFLQDVFDLELADYHIPAGSYQDMLAVLQQGEDADRVLSRLHQAAGGGWLAAHTPALTVALRESPQAVFSCVQTIDLPAARDFCARASAASPLAQHLTWRHLQNSVNKGRRHALQREYQMVRALCRHGEFAEGIRALIIDKDQTPEWSGDTNVAVDAADLLILEAL